MRVKLSLPNELLVFVNGGTVNVYDKDPLSFSRGCLRKVGI